METKEFISLLEDYVCFLDKKSISITSKELAEIFDLSTRECAGMLSYFKNNTNKFKDVCIEVSYSPIGYWIISYKEDMFNKKKEIDNVYIEKIDEMEEVDKMVESDKLIFFFLSVIGMLIILSYLIS